MSFSASSALFKKQSFKTSLQPFTENRKPKTENRKPKTENRKPKTENQGLRWNLAWAAGQAHQREALRISPLPQA
jgi:hypothetical protein